MKTNIVKNINRVLMGIIVVCLLLSPINGFAATNDDLQTEDMISTSDSEVVADQNNEMSGDLEYDKSENIEEMDVVLEGDVTSTERSAEKASWTNLMKKTVKGSSNFKSSWSKTANPSYSTVNYGYSSTADIKTYYTDTWSRYKHRSITKCCNSDGTVKKSKTTSAQSAYHWIAADITTATKYTYVIYQAQKTGALQ